MEVDRREVARVERLISSCEKTRSEKSNDLFFISPEVRVSGIGCNSRETTLSTRM